MKGSYILAMTARLTSWAMHGGLPVSDLSEGPRCWCCGGLLSEVPLQWSYSRGSNISLLSLSTAALHAQVLLFTAWGTWLLIVPCNIITPGIAWLQGLADSTRARDGYQRVPIMSGIGSAVFVNDLADEEVTQAATYVAYLHSQKNNILPVQPGRVHAATEHEAVHA